MNNEKINKILEKRGMVKNCREVWLNNLEKDSILRRKISEETIEILITIALEKGCKAPCYS